MSNKDKTQDPEDTWQPPDPIDLDKIIDASDMWQACQSGQLDDNPARVGIKLMLDEQALQAFRDHTELDAKRSMGTKGGKASGSSRRRIKAAIAPVWIDIAKECRREDPTLTQAKIVDRIRADISEGKDQYRRDIGGDPIFGKSTIAAFLKENLK